MTIIINYENRVKRIRDKMEKRKIDVLIATRTPSITYLTGYLFAWRAAVIIPLEGEVEAVILENDSTRFRSESWIQNIREWGLRRSFGTAISDAAKEHYGQAKIGLELGIPGIIRGERTDEVTLTEYQELKKYLPNAELKDASSVMDETMMIKEEVEIMLLRNAQAICDAGLKAAFNAAKVGVTEIELAGEAEYAMRKAGNEFLWGMTEVGSGYRTTILHNFTLPPTNKIIQRGDVVYLDVHSLFNLYCGDVAGQAVVGEPTAEQKKLSEAFTDAVYTYMDALKPGAVIANVAKLVRGKIAKAGYGDFDVPFLGHGLGAGPFSARIPLL